MRSSKGVLKVDGVRLKTQKSRSAIYADGNKGLFPRPIKLGPRSSGWLESEIDEWLEEQAKQRDKGN